MKVFDKFVPVFKENSWYLQTPASKMLYHPKDFMQDVRHLFNTEHLAYYHDELYKNLMKVVSYEMFHEFTYVWLENTYNLAALLMAEAAHKEVLETATDADKKKMGKLYKRADDAYEKAYTSFAEQFKDW